MYDKLVQQIQGSCHLTARGPGRLGHGWPTCPLDKAAQGVELPRSPHIHVLGRIAMESFSFKFCKQSGTWYLNAVGQKHPRSDRRIFLRMSTLAV